MFVRRWLSNPVPTAIASNDVPAEHLLDSPQRTLRSGWPSDVAVSVNVFRWLSNPVPTAVASNDVPAEHLVDSPPECFAMAGQEMWP